MQQKIEKIFFFFETIASKNVAINCLCSEENTCHRQSMGEQTVLRFCMSVRETFSS